MGAPDTWLGLALSYFLRGDFRKAWRTTNVGLEVRRWATGWLLLIIDDYVVSLVFSGIYLLLGLLYDHSWLIDLIYFHQVLVALKDYLFYLYFWLPPIFIGQLRLVDTSLSDQYTGAFIHGFIHHLLTLISVERWTLSLQVVFEMLLKRGSVCVALYEINFDVGLPWLLHHGT